ALVIAALAALFISMPFFFRVGNRTRAEYFPDPREENLRALHARKDSLLNAIKDIEFDHGLGKLSDEDFEELRGKYRVEAAQVLKEIDALAKNKPARDVDDIEKEIWAERKKFLTSYDDEEIEKEILRAREAAWNTTADATYCSKCGSAYGEEDLFCTRCGAKLNTMTENKNAGSV
ncbi:MAG: zinc ribbon domain-containing protein, partial [Thermodesulfobacteriota bacterium]